MIAVIYVSRAAHAFRGQDFLDLLRKARVNNARDGITGVLLYKDGEFMQGIEGEEAAVARLLERIGRDPRHTDMTILSREPIGQRRFPDWAMGFEHVDDLEPDKRVALNALLTEPLTSEVFKRSPHLAWNLLLAIKGSLK